MNLEAQTLRALQMLWQVLLDLSPSLLLGLFIAGLMHVYLPTGFVHRGLNRPSFGSALRASLFGVPLPLCSCGVIPTALGLRREGASKGATTAFLISTPQTGVDSILVSASFLGWPFALFKLGAAFVTGLVGGSLVNRMTTADPARPMDGQVEDNRRLGLAGVIRYGVHDLLGAIDFWIIIGVLVAVAIGMLVPPDYFSSQGWSRGIWGMLVVLAISLPLYVCATGSVPIAASLIAAGMPAGSALVFLMAGPATNVATIGAVYRTLGGRVLAIYLATVIVGSMAFGLGFEALLPARAEAVVPHRHGIDWLATLSALVLVALILYLQFYRWQQRRKAGEQAMSDTDMTLKVEGMTCMHCVANVKKALESDNSVEEATPDLASGMVRIRGDHLDASALIRLVQQAGYQAAER